MTTVLWDQLIVHEPDTVGVVSQQWVAPMLAEDELFRATPGTFNTQVADDFQVPLGQSWMVNEVRVTGNYVNGGLGNVFIYEPSTTQPGVPSEVPTSSFLSVPIDNTLGNNRLGFTLTPAPLLTSGNYWVGVQVQVPATFNVSNQANFNAWAWDTNPNVILNTAVFENPLNGFNTGAITFTPTTSLVPLAGPSQSFRLLGTILGPVPCLHPETRVHTIYGFKNIKDIKSGDFVFDHTGKPTRVVYNMKFPKTNSFVTVPAGSMDKNVPEKDLLIRKLHPVLYKGQEIQPLEFARKYKKTHLIKEIEIPIKVDVWSLCTKKRVFVMMQGLPVATWEQEDWEQHSNKKKITYKKQ